MCAIKKKCANRLREKEVSRSVVIEPQAHTVIVVYDRLEDRHNEEIGSYFDLLATLAVTRATHGHSLCVRDSVRRVAVTVAVANAAAAATNRSWVVVTVAATGRVRCSRTTATSADGGFTATTRGHRVGRLCKMCVRETLNCGIGSVRNRPIE